MNENKNIELLAMIIKYWMTVNNCDCFLLNKSK